jgi:Glyoxalase-like domain
VVQFDHLTHWVPDLDAAMGDYQALGFTVRRAGQHPGFGLHNAGWRLDTRYIELIAVRDEAVARAGLGPGWPEIDALLRAGGGAEGFAVLVTDIPATVADLRSRGIPVSDPQYGSIQRTNGSIGGWQRASLLDGPRWAPVFINYGRPIGEWAARFRDKGYPKDPWVLHDMTVEVPDPLASAGWLAAVLGLDVSRIGQDAARVPLPGCAISFVPGPADRITAVALNGLGAPRGSVAGLRYRDTGSATPSSG